MNSRKKVTARFFTPLIAALAGAVAPLMMACAKAHGEGFKLRATIADTNLRKAPRTDSKILMLIPNGTVVEAGDCRGAWCRVSWSGQDGYAIGRNLSIAAPLRWPDTLATFVPDGRDSSQKPAKTARKSEEHEAREHEEGGPEHRFILEIGTAGEWPVNGRPNFGGTFAAEVEPIENWLELEFGLSTLATAGHTEISGDLLFKKPFRLSPAVEFMIGGGPSFSRTLNGPERGDSWSAEFALDWMFWPTKDIGWFIEPTWSVNPRNGQQAAAVSIGVLIGFPK